MPEQIGASTIEPQVAPPEQGGTPQLQTTPTISDQKPRSWATLVPLFVIAATVIVIDRLIKIWVQNSLGGPTGAYIQPIIPGWLELRYTQNTGAAFGIFQGGSWVLALIAAIVSAAIIYSAPRIRQDSANARLGWYGLIGLSLVLGGALGNLIDRLLYGYVVDFVDFYGVGIDFNNRRYQWGIFNGADSAISIGIVILLISLFIGNKESKPNT